MDIGRRRGAITVTVNTLVSDQRSCSTSGTVTTRLGDYVGM